MSKIAILVAANIHNRKGLFNAAHERIKHLKEISNAEIDTYLISTYKPDFYAMIKGVKPESRPDSFEIDGVVYRILWLKNTLVDYVLMHKLNRLGWTRMSDFRRLYVSLFKDYDLVVAHSCAEFAYNIFCKYGVPYVATWHGSDIHTYPFQSRQNLESTRLHIENATHNLFVSKALLETSKQITTLGQKSVSYNGMDKSFKTLSTETKKCLSDKYGKKHKVVAFVGNLIPVKNIKVLPAIFKQIYTTFPDVQFWIIGRGPLMESFKKETMELPITFWGNVPREEMPNLLNAVDVLVLPSLNEGLPLVTVEALKCGCNVVGSRVGGIPESIGIENTIPLEAPTFEKEFANCCVRYLNNPKVQKLESCFDWSLTAEKENEIIKQILS